MKENEQLYIARCMVDIKHERCKDYKRCSHAKPHTAMEFCSKYVNRCICIPVPLEYYIEEILKQKQEK